MTNVRGNAQVFDTIAAAFDKALEDVVEGQEVLVTGSFFTVSEVLTYIRNSGWQ